MRCLQALWTQDPVEFDGEFYTVPRSHVGPALRTQGVTEVFVDLNLSPRVGSLDAFAPGDR